MAPNLRQVGRLLIVTAVAVAGLRVLDSVPRVLSGLPRGIVLVRSLEELRSLVGFDMPMPAYFPATLEWPPRDIWVYRGQDVAVIVRQRATNAPGLIVARAAPGARELSGPVLPAATVLQDTDVPAGTGPPLRVQRVEDAARAVWHQVTWRQADRVTIVRYRGPLDELMRIAESLRARSAR